ncbi:DUF3226 domain-containing protein [Bacteroides graminisolvens]|uniref:Uncharacterized protein n=1 Tax=Bacteroides graminisolvens DSM 19988 = JCM 15093 TaxID=1121097 RepID=A0A069CYG6_9BACE|nr:DUF3226 domain-containing protein [Bacteroides graminisolvens]GAK35623.1 hypothetical protein JCM15093_728 [Bacteroides graminisolvens DSM 19988 = JCM 15093]
MSKVCIFIESDKETTNEGHFVRHMAKLVYAGDSKEIEIVGTGGYTNLDQFAVQMQRNTDNGIKNLVIFDADFPKEGGFEKRKAELLSVKAEKGVDFELFLFPNNKDDGTFEHLLEHLATEEHKGLLECFEGYESCIRGRNNPKYISPDQKAKMYAYVSTQTDPKYIKMFKKGDWRFNQTDLWNLDVDYLTPLKDFLSSNLE